MSVPLLCVAGTLCDRRIFAPMLAAAGEADARCTAVEHPTVRKAAAAILPSAPERFVAVGQSLGGFVAIEIARRAPDRVAGLALLGSNARADPAANADGRRAQLRRFQADGGAAVIDEIWRSCVARGNLARADLRSVLAAMADDTPVERFAAQIEVAISRPDARDALGKLAMPVLAVQGSEDVMCPPDRAAEIAAASRGSAAIVPDGGHFVLLEQPNGVADALAAWLKQEGLR